jgi:hypothetical protein
LETALTAQKSPIYITHKIADAQHTYSNLQGYLESFEMWCWRRMEINWTNCMRNEVLQGVKKKGISHKK